MRINNMILTLGIVAGFSLAMLPAPSSAVDVFEGCPAGNPICGEAKDGKKIESFVGTIVNTLLYIIGAVAVIVIILGGISYVTSTGDPAAITKAKSSITYAVIGLVIAILAYAIVNYVVGVFKPTAQAAIITSSLNQNAVQNTASGR